MIIGRDLLTELGMIINFQDKTVSLDTDTISIREKGNLKALKLLTKVYLTTNEPKLLKDAYSHSNKMLDAEHNMSLQYYRKSLITVTTSVRRKNSNYCSYSKNMNIYLMEH
jgi:hypothetical protein